MSSVRLDNPLVIQGDYTALVEVDSPRYAAARDELVRFAELVKSPEHVHTYRITPLSIWNACAAGVAPDEIGAALQEYAKSRSRPTCSPASGTSPRGTAGCGLCARPRVSS